MQKTPCLKQTSARANVGIPTPLAESIPVVGLALNLFGTFEWLDECDWRVGEGLSGNADWLVLKNVFTVLSPHRLTKYIHMCTVQF